MFSIILDRFRFSPSGREPWLRGSHGRVVGWSSGRMVHMSGGPVVGWSTCRVVQWSDGPVVGWSTCRVVQWSDGPHVGWSSGRVSGPPASFVLSKFKDKLVCICKLHVICG